MGTLKALLNNDTPQQSLCVCARVDVFSLALLGHAHVLPQTKSWIHARAHIHTHTAQLKLNHLFFLKQFLPFWEKQSPRNEFPSSVIQKWFSEVPSVVTVLSLCVFFLAKISRLLGVKGGIHHWTLIQLQGLVPVQTYCYLGNSYWWYPVILTVVQVVILADCQICSRQWNSFLFTVSFFKVVAYIESY